MTFAVSGAVITQSGVDSSLAAIDATGAVKTEELGALTGDRRYTTYLVFATGGKLVVNGTLTINPNLECLFFDSNVSNMTIYVAAGATLKIDGRKTASGKADLVTKHIGVRSSRQGPSHHWYPDTSQCYGTLEINSAAVWLNVPINFYRPSRFVARDAELRLGNASSGFANLFRMDTDNSTMDIINFTLIESSIALHPNVQYVNFIGFSPRWCKEGLLSRKAEGAFHDVTSFNPVACDTDIAFLGGTSQTGGVRIFSRYKFYGTPAHEMTVRTHYDHTISKGIAEIRKVVEVMVIDVANAVVAGAKVWIKNYNHGGRIDLSFVGGLYVRQDGDYSGTTPATGALTMDVLLAVAADNQTYVGKNSVRTFAWDYHHKNNSNDFKNDIFIYQYGYLPSMIADADLRGLNRIASFERAVLADNNITESNIATVLGYASIDSAFAFYDRAAAWTYDNFTNQTAHAVRRAGNKIITTKNIVIDKTAPAAYVETAAAITIKASAFGGDLETTGTISLAHGAVASGALKDRNGVRFAFIGLPSGNSIYGTLTTAAGVVTPVSWQSVIGDRIVFTLAANTTIRLFVKAPGKKPKIITADSGSNGGVETVELTDITGYDSSVVINDITDNLSFSFDDQGDTVAANDRFNVTITITSANQFGQLNNTKQIMLYDYLANTPQFAQMAMAQDSTMFVDVDARGKLVVNSPHIFLRLPNGSREQALWGAEVDTSGISAGSYAINPPNDLGYSVVMVYLNEPRDFDTATVAAALTANKAVSDTNQRLLKKVAATRNV